MTLKSETFSGSAILNESTGREDILMAVETAILRASNGARASGYEPLWESVDISTDKNFVDDRTIVDAYTGVTRSYSSVVVMLLGVKEVQDGSE